MSAKPDPALLALPPEKRPGSAPYLLDASLYNGRYYLYFGVTPALTILWPYTLLTGKELAVDYVVAGQTTLACWLGLGILYWARREFFPRASRGSLFFAATALAFASAAPMALRKSEVYEAAVTAGFLWGMAMLFFCARAIRHERWQIGGLICASFSAGLAVGSRPNLLVGTLALGAGVAWLVWRNRGENVQRQIGWVVAAVLPAAVCGIGLAYYNYIRFGSPLEFGHKFQVGSIADNYVSLRYFIHNVTVYYLTAPSAGWFFPFFSPGLEGARPAGYIGIEYIHGEWWFLPWLVGLPILGLVFRRRIDWQNPLTAIVGVVAVWFVANFALVASISARANRYMLDFHPALVLLAGLMLLAWSARAGTWRIAYGIGVFAVMVAAFVNIMESFQVHEFFRHGNPVLYAKIERSVNRVAWKLHRQTNPAFGALAMNVVFPDSPAGSREPLLSTGAPMLSNTIWFVSLGPGRGRLEFDHEGEGGARGPDFNFVPGRAHAVKIWLGSLLPPVEHPWFDRIAPALVQRQKQAAIVQLDGVVVFFSSAVPNDSSPGQVRIGSRLIHYTNDRPKFSGRIERVERLSEPPPVPGPATAEETLAYGLKVLLPQDRFGVAEPLVATGVRGRGDLILVEYSTPETIRLGHDQIGGGIEWSAPVQVDYAVPQEFEIRLLPTVLTDPLASGSGVILRPLVRLAGREVPIGINPLHVFEPAQMAVGCNTVGASSARIYFAGTLLSWQFLGDGVRRNVAGNSSGADMQTSFILPHELAGAEPVLSFRNAANARGVLAVRGAGEGLVQLGWIEAQSSVWSGPIPVIPGGNVNLEMRYRKPFEPLATERGPVSAENFLRDRTFFRWNGVDVFQPRVAFFDSKIVASTGWISAVDGRPDIAKRFTGEIGLATTRPQSVSEEKNNKERASRTVRMVVRFPSNRAGVSEPVLTTGRQGAADSVFVRYRDDHKVSLGFDHWGVGGPESEPVAIDFAQTHELELTLGEGPWADGGSGMLRMQLDGRLLLERQVVFHPTKAEEIRFGENPVGLSTSVPEFSGELCALESR